MATEKETTASPFLSSLSASCPGYEFPTITIPPSEFDENMNQKPKRCCFDGCKKKLMLSDFACKCGKYHCSTHRPCEVHNCLFDFKGEHKNVLLKTMNEKIVANKVEKI